ncbi:LysR family transcriptional regulator [Hydrogenophaga pseudoflava]|uniref:LysR family transcriptional regulator n=1 Tax=Hydrogenophaga pseudoflava TaxID=47421 RepID=UPI0027E49986|nr:LysR family transcriptional regulator [Hydrogenophaga pseudoflava]MDQ7744155.1 LysR family transcriptional regulator [Hydrogenophaga pseudoflava]
MAAIPASLRNRLKLRQLALLAELQAAGSLHKAADQLGMSQPAATRLIQELESLMDAALFERTSRGMVPTDMGRLLMRHASMVLVGLDHVYQEALNLRSGNAGVLSVGMFPGAPSQLLTDAIVRLKADSPLMEVRLFEGTNEVLLSDLREGRLDLVLGRAPSMETKGAFAFERLYTERFSVVCGAHHRVSESMIKDLASLVDLPWVLPFPSATLRRNLEALFLSECGRLPHDIVEAVAPTLVVPLITGSLRLAAMPQWVARDHGVGARLRVLISQLPHVTGPIGVITRSGEAVSSQARRLVEELRQVRDTFTATQGDADTGSPVSKL